MDTVYTIKSDSYYTVTTKTSTPASIIITNVNLGIPANTNSDLYLNLAFPSGSPSIGLILTAQNSKTTFSVVMVAAGTT